MPAFPYQDPSLPNDRRVEDLLERIDLETKAGLMFHDMVAIGDRGALAGADNFLGRPATAEAITRLRMNHFNVVGAITSIPELVRWHNTVQLRARETGWGIPVTISTDPRHGFTSNPGTAASPGRFSQWPETLGLAALRDPDLVERYADIARQEYVAAGLRVALHPQIDLTTEPRWSRAGMTFGEDATLTAQLVAAYIRGFRGDGKGADSVATMVKHFPGGGPQKDGEDPHFSYGTDQVYPSGRFDYHLEPFRAAIAAGASQMMPYYGKPVGTEYEEVAFAFNRGIITGILREELGFTGIVCTDWGVLTDDIIFGQPMPARAWGLEEATPLERAARAIDAGVDQFGGESRPELIVSAVRGGRVTEARIDESVRRLLRAKFDLGLFDAGPLDVDHAMATIGRPDFVAAGAQAQRAAIVRLTTAAEGPAVLPLRTGLRVYAEGIADDAVSQLGTPVPDPAAADIAVLRLQAPYEPRPGGFESQFHAGSLEFPAAERDRILQICRTVPTILDIYLDRAAVLTPFVDAAAAILVDFGASDTAVTDVLTGVAHARGRLPFDLPSSMAAVIASPSDAPFATTDPLFRFGDGILDD